MKTIDWGGTLTLGLIKALYQTKRAESLSAAGIERLQRKRLLKLLRHVLTHSPFYNKYYGDHGIKISNLDSVTLTDLPIIDKQILMKHFDGLVCSRELHLAELWKFLDDPANRRKKFQETFRIIHSSGSSGTMGVFVYGPRDWNVVQALNVVRAGKIFLLPLKKVRLAFIGATDGDYAGAALASEWPRFMAESLLLNINSPLGEICRRVNEFRPTILVGYTSGIHLLAKQQKAGNILIRPRIIINSADPLTAEIRETVRSAFGVRPINLYAASESLAIAAQCAGDEEAIHVFADWNCLEAVDEQNNRVRPGTIGAAVLTNLYNFTQPIIRYRLGDEIVFKKKKCSCGSNFPLIGAVIGRQSEMLVFLRSNGEKEYVNPLSIEFVHPDIERVQVVQTARNELLLRAVIPTRKDAALSFIHKEMNTILREKKLQDSVTFSVMSVDGIPNDPKTGKFRFILPFKE